MKTTKQLEGIVSEEETKVLTITCELKYWVEKKKKENCPSKIVLELTDCYNCPGNNNKCSMYVPRVEYSG